LNIGSNVNTAKKHKFHQNLIATGGKENDLKLWDIASQKPDVPSFRAKNMPDNWVGLREPVWIKCIDFIDENRVAVGTAHHQVINLTFEKLVYLN
jgi:ribosome biogenesis protein NSA1